MEKKFKPVFFKTPSGLRKWFDRNHVTKKELWVGYYKKNTGKQTITHSEVVDEALCFGWIDGTGKRVDEERYAVRFTPRKPRSIWSKINIAKVEKLRAAGKMTSAGLKAVEAGKASGAWDSAYRSKDPTEIPADLKTALKKNPTAWKNFQQYSNTNKFIFIWRVNKIKGAELRAQKIKKAVGLIEKNLKPNDSKGKSLF
jgi:uncharacterized protein YdeI (YjbR/CyaY-like superfamily)